ncbi:methyl-accepting chemotaxis protein [Candidatus Venteria ishoeyi]|uniref:methyl-accepting chemotaxis protein n=1 Tax=Candidatus Venteria ishoeyi TaxID=1899563 RepID=UPI0025A6899F|nr:methyl-accepting chemotaxis protein [Candidatus Venteria ishoeyi]MDM8548088.1 methyl-accepting chemotaxis protein [Candidatus Venteria ishoeyi]
MSIKRYLSISYTIIVLGIIGLGILSWLMSNYQATLNQKHQQRYTSYLLADELRQSSDDLTRLARTYVVSGDARYEKMYWHILDIRNGKKPRPQHYERIYWDNVLDYGDKPRSDGETIALKKLMEAAGFIKAEFEQLHQAQQNSDGLVTTETIAMNAIKGLYNDGNGNYTRQSAPDPEMARRIMHDLKYHQDKSAIMQPIDKFFQLLDVRTQQEVEEYQQKYKLILLLIQLLVVILAVVSIFIGVVVSLRILHQIGGEPTHIAKLAKMVAQGKLNITFDAEKSTGVYAELQHMVGQLQKVISNIRHTVADISNMAQELNDTAQNLSQSSSNQAASVEQVSASLEEINSTVNQNAQITEETNQRSQSAANMANISGQAVTDTVSAMQQIAKEISIVEEIAYRTNLLALNAAIEAARAGEHGHGFTVVADEIRKLAERSQGAAQKISSLAIESVKTAEHTGGLLQGLLPNIEQNAVAIESIAIASAEQTSGLEQINLAIAQVDQSTQQNAAGAEQLAASSQSLQEQAEQLQNAVAYFSVEK